MGSTKKKSTERRLPSKLGGGLEGAPAFLDASDEEIRNAYREDLKRIASLLKFANESIHLREMGSEAWLDGAGWIDKVCAALDVNGWSVARRARVQLIRAVDAAVHHETRTHEFAESLRTMKELGNRLDLNGEERERFRAASVELLKMPSAGLAEKFAAVAEKDPNKDTVLFAAFMFRMWCPKFARGLVTPEGVAALEAAVASWRRTKGRPKKGETTLPKWEALDALMKAAGLAGCTSESLETDWRTHQARQK